MKNSILWVVVVAVVAGGYWWYATQDSAQTEDTSLAIAGTWRSIDDSAFVRELRPDGTFADWHGGEMVDDGTWGVFSKKNAPETSFPVEENAVYLQLTTEHDHVDVMSFKVSKHTAEELELVYMERGGVLKFMRVESR